MFKNSFRWVVAFVAIVIVLASSVMFSVREGQYAVVTRFGAPKNTLREAGLHWKLPWPIDRVHFLDGRDQLFNSRYAETLTHDKKNIILRMFVVWGIGDPLTFLQAMGTEEIAEDRLDGLITDAKNAVLGTYDLAALVNTDTEQLRLSEIEAKVLAQVEKVAKDRYGIVVRQVGLKQLGFPAANIREIFDQMRAERTRVASKIRAEGDRESKRIRAETEKRIAKLRAEGDLEAKRIRAEAAGEVNRIYRESYGQEPALFRWLRKIQAAKDILGERSMLIMKTDTPPFDVLLQPTPGTAVAPTKPGATEKSGNRK